MIIPPERFRWLRTWPLLIAAVIAFTAGTRLLTDEGSRELAAAALVAMGAVCLGSWITMLASHDYSGREPDDRQDDDGKP
jgi:hypothetical protein